MKNLLVIGLLLVAAAHGQEYWAGPGYWGDVNLGILKKDIVEYLDNYSNSQNTKSPEHIVDALKAHYNKKGWINYKKYLTSKQVNQVMPGLKEEGKVFQASGGWWYIPKTFYGGEKA